MQPTPPSDEARTELGKDLAATPAEPQAERAEARQQAQSDPVEIDEPRKRWWRFWRRQNRR